MLYEDPWTMINNSIHPSIQPTYNIKDDLPWTPRKTVRQKDRKTDHTIRFRIIGGTFLNFVCNGCLESIFWSFLALFKTYSKHCWVSLAMFLPCCVLYVVYYDLKHCFVPLFKCIAVWLCAVSLSKYERVHYSFEAVLCAVS